MNPWAPPARLRTCEDRVRRPPRPGGGLRLGCRGRRGAPALPLPGLDVAEPLGGGVRRALPALAATVGLGADVMLEERCPVLGLPSSWDTYLASLSGKHRHELTRKIRRFEREAPDGRAVVVRGPEAVAARLGDFLALHRRSRVGKAKFMDDRMERFFRAALPALAQHDGVALWFLEAAG